MSDLDRLKDLLQKSGILRSELHKIMGVPKGTVDSWFSSGKVSRWVWSWFDLYIENMFLKSRLRDLEITVRTMVNIVKDEPTQYITHTIQPTNPKETTKSDTIGELLKSKKLIHGEKIYFKDAFPDNITNYYTATITGETRKRAVIWDYDGNYYSITRLTQIIKNTNIPLNGTLFWVNKDGITLWEMR